MVKKLTLQPFILYFSLIVWRLVRESGQRKIYAKNYRICGGAFEKYLTSYFPAKTNSASANSFG